MRHMQSNALIFPKDTNPVNLRSWDSTHLGQYAKQICKARAKGYAHHMIGYHTVPGQVLNYRVEHYTYMVYTWDKLTHL